MLLSQKAHLPSSKNPAANLPKSGYTVSSGVQKRNYANRDKTMTATQQNLNLARKWRPKTFDTVVGQDIAVRMLKNSLYLNKFFPVYLFAGQRGCGKTSSARIFAAAINCDQLSEFQKNPASCSIPCLTCSSCTAMINADHPDFIEIDAASHTGVDNVRQIIESSSYMPLIGRKKVYLIDEAHMLSKAAFNAFLKILEEPPLTVIFILATTDTPKIPTTVLSRCFQLTFGPIDTESLKLHIQQICTNEQVTIDDAALDILINETEGSARDAINLLERVRFSSDAITQETILAVLGKISINELFALFELVIDQNASGMITQLGLVHFEQRSPQLLWDLLIELCRNLMWVKYGIVTLSSGMTQHLDHLKELARKCSINRLVAMLNFFWSQEELFVKTNKKHMFLEITLLQLCQQVNLNDLDDIIKACGSPQSSQSAPAGQSKGSQASGVAKAMADSLHEATPDKLAQARTPEPLSKAIAPAASPTLQASAPIQTTPASSVQDPDWALFLEAITNLGDLLLHSILTQAAFIKKDEPSKRIVIQLSAESTFFKNKIEETKPQWQPLLSNVFAGYKDFMFAPPTPQAPGPLPSVRQSYSVASSQISPIAPTARQTPFVNPASTRPTARENDYLIIKDEAQWPQASLLLRFFSGKIKKIDNKYNTFLPSPTGS